MWARLHRKRRKKQLCALCGNYVGKNKALYYFERFFYKTFFCCKPCKKFSEAYPKLIYDRFDLFEVGAIKYLFELHNVTTHKQLINIINDD